MEIRFENVTKKFYSKKSEVIAVNSLNLTVESGKLIGFLGPSGCGKSTALFLLSGLHALTEGKIFFGENDISDLPPEKRGVGLVFQNYALFPHLTVEQNIRFPLVNSKTTKQKLKAEIEERGIPKKQYIAELVDEVAKIVDISALLKRRPSELSGGQQQRVAIARALVKKPNILLLDEPLSNLDARLRLQTREEIRKIQQKTGITTIFVTHDQEEAMNICDYIAILKEGKLQQYGTAQEIYDSPCNKFVAEFLGAIPINIANGVIREGSLFLSDTKISNKTELPDGEVTLGIRPESLYVSNKGAIKGIVGGIKKFNGVSVVELLLSDGQSIRFLSERTNKIELGGEISVAIMPRSVSVFDASGEKVEQC